MTRVCNGPEPFEQLWKRTNQGSFLWSLVKILSVVLEKMFKDCGWTNGWRWRCCRRQQTVSDHNSSPWAFSSGELTKPVSHHFMSDGHSINDFHVSPFRQTPDNIWTPIFYWKIMYLKIAKQDTKTAKPDPVTCQLCFFFFYTFWSKANRTVTELIWKHNMEIQLFECWICGKLYMWKDMPHRHSIKIHETPEIS